MPESERFDRRTWVVHFRTSRGAGGVEHATARAELIAAARHLPVAIVHEHAAFNRVWLAAPPECEPELLALMPRLGYAEALTRVDTHVGAGVGVQHRPPEKIERWLVGEYRRGDDLEVHTLIWRADEKARRARSPHLRQFKMRLDGEVQRTLSRRQHRRLSCCDAMVMLNLARVDDGALVVDPFAGIGGIVLEARRFGYRCVCGDISAALAPGLREIAGGPAAVWNAAALPLPARCADAVVTEPPYEAEAQEEVIRAMPEIARILRPGGRAVIMMEQPLIGPPLQAATEAGLRERERYLVRRARGMRASILVLERPTADSAPVAGESDKDE